MWALARVEVNAACLAQQVTLPSGVERETPRGRGQVLQLRPGGVPPPVLTLVVLRAGSESTDYHAHRVVPEVPQHGCGVLVEVGDAVVHGEQHRLAREHYLMPGCPLHVLWHGDGVIPA